MIAVPDHDDRYAPAHPPVVLIDGDAPRNELLHTLVSLSRSGGGFVVHVLSPQLREAIDGDEHLRAALPTELRVLSGEPQTVLELLQSSRSDVVVVRAGSQLTPGWLARLKAVAYSDSVCATASALALPSTRTSADMEAFEPDDRQQSPDRSTVVEQPRWGAVYIRRDALELVAWTIAEGDQLVPSLEGALASPGLAHRLAMDVVVAAGQADGPAPAEGRESARAGLAQLERIRVLVDARCFERPLSGTQVHVVNLARGLELTGEVDVSLLLPRDVHPSVAPHVERLATTVRRYTMDRLPTQPPQIFHRPYQFGSVRDIDECRGIGERLVLTHQDMILDRTPAYHVRPEAWENFVATTSLAFTVADQVGFFSRHAAADAASDGRLSADRINVVPLGVDHASLAADAEPPSPRPDDPFLLQIGGSYLHKNRLFSLRLLEQLATAHGWTGTLVLAGDHLERGSSVAQEVAYLSQREALRDRVLDVGRVTDAEKRWLYERARLVLFPSLYEGFGLVPFEAAACGTPCVYGWRSSLPDYLPTEGGVLAGWNLGACAEAVYELLNDDDRSNALVTAIRRAGFHLTWTGTGRGYVEVYRRALASSARTPPRARHARREPGVATLTSREARVLDVHRRRRVMRASVVIIIVLGTRTLRLARAIGRKRFTS